MAKLLIVDDQAGIRFFLTELFKNTYDLTLAENGQEALDYFKKAAQTVDDKFDMVLTDMKMPLLDGLDLIRAIRELDTKVAIVIMTAYNESCTMDDLRQLKVADTITKPFDMYNVREIVSTNIAKGAGA